MTKPSSSLLRQPLDKPLLVDKSGALAPLDELVGSGGEGSVYTLRGIPGVVAKVYHKPKLPEAHARKLERLTSLADESMHAISAWPRGLLFDPSNKRVRGLLMRRVEDAHALHELYGTTTRARTFPHAHWGHLALAARNAAAAFGTMHEHGVVVGDVNQGNLVVDANMCVQFIDCDSFQVNFRGEVFRCPVGTPHFTPPELQAIRLADVDRTVDHDAFGLAVLMFHLLFVGRHPYAGRFRGKGDMTIERAIAERRFAFSRDKEATQVDPPPASLMLEDLPSKVGDLFEQAFRPPEGAPRPTAGQWVAALDEMIKSLATCDLDESHCYYSGAMGCPWCRIENAGGPTFFMNAALVDGSSESRLAALDSQLEKVSATAFPELPSTALKLPKMALMTPPAEPPRKGTPDWLAMGYVASAAVCVLGSPFWPALAAGAVGVLGTVGGLAFGAAGRERRRNLEERDAALQERLQGLAGVTRQIVANHAGRKQEHDAYAATVSTGMQRYRSDTEDLNTILQQLRAEQKEDFLRGFSIRDYRRRIPGLDPPTVAVLESYGIDSAYHVQKSLITGVPTVDSDLQMELLAWRGRMEERFTYNAEEGGVTERELNANRQEATRRFKIALARKLIQGRKRMRSMGFAAQGQLDRELNSYKRRVSAWRELAKERQAEEARRTPLERKLNQSLAVLATAAAAPLFLGLLGWLVLG